MGREEGASGFDRISPGDVPRKGLEGGAWSKVLLSEETAPGSTVTLGYATFPVGSVTETIRHTVDEACYVVQGEGRISNANGVLEFHQGDAIRIPSGAWHAIASGGTVDAVMVFAFPTPNYPPTEAQYRE